MKLPITTLALVRGSAVVAISALSACGTSSTSTPPPVAPQQVAQVSAPADPPTTSTQNASPGVSSSEPLYDSAGACGRG